MYTYYKAEILRCFFTEKIPTNKLTNPETPYISLFQIPILDYP